MNRLLFANTKIHNSQENNHSIDNQLNFEKNPFIDFGFLLLLFIKNSKRLKKIENMNHLQNFIIQKLSDFQNQLAHHFISPENIHIASYCLCAALDEAIMKSTINNKFDWSHFSLLSLKYKESLAGDHFFTFLEQLSPYKAKDIFILEFIYTILCLRFVGKYHTYNQNRLQQIKDELRNYLWTNRHPDNYKLLLNNNTSHITKKKHVTIFNLSLWMTLMIFFSLNAIIGIKSHFITNNINQQIVLLKTPYQNIKMTNNKNFDNYKS